MPADAEVLTVEYKVNFFSPGTGDRMIARGRVTKPGRTITVCVGDVFGVRKEKQGGHIHGKTEMSIGGAGRATRAAP